MSTTSVVIVTHDSQAVINHCLEALRRQTVKPDSVVLVDSGSADCSYLSQCQDGDLDITVLPQGNIGFSGANNVGYRYVEHVSDYVLFLNPDAFPAPGSLARAVAFFEANPSVGCLGGRLLGYDPTEQQPTGRLDSTGVFRKWYGRWYDRGQGVLDDGQYNLQEDVPAVCGAFLFCRKKVLDQVALQDGVVFDPYFFLYKEDIELCLRIRRTHWRIVYLPDIQVYHCRGWQKRGRIPYQLRLNASANEVLLYAKHPSPYMIWALAKYLLVRWLRI